MQWVALLFGSLFAGVIQWFSRYMARRIAVYAAMFTFITGLTVAFVAAIRVLYIGLGELGMPGWAMTAACWVVPSNADEVVAVYFSARILRWAYWRNISMVVAKVGNT
jgi:hypothetical protein